MDLTKRIDLKQMAALSQWDKVLLMLGLTCALPFLFHAFPWAAGPGMGQRWLPMFYAPLIASLCFRPHVALIVAIGGPVINHTLFGMPDQHILPGLIFELVALNAALVLFSQRQPVRGWHVAAGFILVRIVSLLIFVHAVDTIADSVWRSFLMAWPGVVLMAALVEVIGHARRRAE